MDSGDSLVDDPFSCKQRGGGGGRYHVLITIVRDCECTEDVRLGPQNFEREP